MTELTQRTVLALEVAEAWNLAVAAVAVLALVLVGLRSVTRVSRARAVVLGALRTALAAAVVMLALRPVLRTESLAVRTTPVAVVVDASASMAVRDQPGGQTRSEAMAGWVRRHERLLRELEEVAVVDWFAAADGELRASSRLEVASSASPPAGGTDLASSLAALRERYPGGRRPGVLLLSDGADHGELGRRLRAEPPPEDLIEPGGELVVVAPEAGGLADLALDLLARDPIGFLRTDVTIRARVRSVGLPEGDVPVSLVRDDQVVTVRNVRVGGAAGASAEVTFTIQPVQVGEALYRLQLPVRSGEAVTTNNEAVFSVRAVRDRLRVLQVCGRPSWDGRFLRELLKRDPAIDLVSFFILRSAWDDTHAEVNELSLIPFPVAELFGEKLGGFDLVIFQNFDMEPYGIGAHAHDIRRHVVEDGGAMVVIGGDLAFGRDYRRPELAEILPVDVDRRASWSATSARVVPTDVGRRHPILELAAEGREPAGLFDDLLPVSGTNSGLAPHADAHVLLEAEGAEQQPILVAGDVGRGRVLVLATDGTWRWSLPMAGRGGSTRTYERFWQQAIRWLVRDARSSLVVVEADRRTLGPGESAEVRVHVRDSAYRPEPGVTVTFTVADADGEEQRSEEAVTDESGVARVVVEPATPGIHAVRVTSSRGMAGPLHLERLDPGRELADAAVDLPVLRALAEAAGGQVHDVGEELQDLPFHADREVRVEAVNVFPLWRTWWAWAAIALLTCTEWWARRRWGLA